MKCSTFTRRGALKALGGLGAAAFLPGCARTASAVSTAAGQLGLTDITDEDKAIEAMVKPFENFANAIDDANPPKDLKDWHDQTVETLDDVVKKLKDGDVEALSSFGDSPLPEPPADASERLQKIADKNKDCQDADFAFGSGE